MAFDIEFFANMFRTYPELLTFLSKNVEVSQDYITAFAPSWAHEMYHAAQLALKQIHSSAETDFLTSYLKTVEYPEKVIDADKSKTSKLKTEIATKDRRIELERTMLSIMVGVAIHDNNDDFFEKTPTIGIPISKAQLKQLYTLCSENFPEAKDWELVHIKLVLGDLGKISLLRDKISHEFGLREKDPDKFLSEMLELGFDKLAVILPCINRLGKARFIELRAMSPAIHYGHFAQAECSSIKLHDLQTNIKSHGITCLNRSMVVQVLDVAGALAQNGGRILLNKDIVATYLDYMLPCLRQLEQEEVDVVYNQYLSNRLRLCGIEAESKLNDTAFILARIICMFRVYEPEKAKKFQQALEVLSSDATFMLDIRQIFNYEKFPTYETPTYIPALLAAIIDERNIMQLALPHEKNPQAVALRIGMRIIANTLKAHQDLVIKGKISPINPVNFNLLTGQIKSDFSLISGLCKTKGICFDKNTMTVYPPSWVLRHKNRCIQDYVGANGPLRKSTIVRKGVFAVFAVTAVYVASKIATNSINRNHSA